MNIRSRKTYNWKSNSYTRGEEIYAISNGRIAFYIAVAIIVAIYFHPFGGKVFFPFSLLGVFTHEVGHGVGAIAVGGEVINFQIYENFSGLAQVQMNDAPLAKAFMSASGMLLPSIIGGIILIISRRFDASSAALILIAMAIFVPTHFWYKGSISVYWLYGASLFFLTSLILSDIIRSIIAQVAGLNLCLFSILNFTYALADDAFVDGRVFHSDTKNIAMNIGGEYWMYGILLIIYTSFIIYASIGYSSE